MPNKLHQYCHHPLATGLAPVWTSGWGDDEYGPWVEISVEHLQQRLRWIPPGDFLMGSPETEAVREEIEGPQHQVSLSEGFWLFDTAVTQGLWEAVMGMNPSYFNELPDNDTHPVECVSWEDCQRFISRMNEIIPGLNLVLPTEAQWEYACRAETKTVFHFGETLTPSLANYDGNFPYTDEKVGEYREQTLPVKSFTPNARGLYQMHGNVFEWCYDGRREYSIEPQNNPIGPLDGSFSVVRGGGWHSSGRHLRAASRSRLERHFSDDGLGFRCARVQG